MIILPRYHTQNPKLAGFTANELERAPSVGTKPIKQGAQHWTKLPPKQKKPNPPQQNEALKVNDGAPVEGNVEPQTQEHQAFPIASAGLHAPQSEFDEYGTELGPEARVWKTYVKEADRFDGEKVEEWNKSLDVILIFAALFSAISTAFVIESSKRLQPDPTEASAQTLTLISLTLLSLANSSQPPALSGSTRPMDGQFKPTSSAVCVNALWFLSLSLSVAVSLIAMLAKEWCHRFMSGRTGEMYSQAKRRQQRWEGLETWKMEEVLMFLPSLIHLALFLFAIGLCIYLWDMHFGVAIPVAIITLATLGVYVASTLLPLFYQLCPYNTTASRFIASIFDKLTQRTGDTSSSSLEQDLTTSKALCWLINECEDPRSVDTALQAIAGADKNLPLDPLKLCHADAMVCQRLTAGSSYPTTYETVFELYARAFAVLHPPNSDQGGEKGGYNHANELRRKIRELQVISERAVADQLVTQEFLPTQDNLLALRIGSTAPSYCLQSLGYESHARILDSLDSGLDLLGRYMNDWDDIHPSSLQSLIVGMAMLLACLSIHADRPTAASYAVRLLRCFDRFAPLPQHEAVLHRFVLAASYERKQYIGFLLAVFAVSQHDYPGWTHPSPLGPTARAERAIEIITYYASALHVLTKEFFPKPFARNLGLLGLLLRSEEYILADRDYETIYKEISPASSDTAPSIHTLPQRFSLAQFTVDMIEQKVSDPSIYGQIISNSSVVRAHLTVLHKTCEQYSGSAPPHIYIFALEATLRFSPSATTWDTRDSIHTPLMEHLSPPKPSIELVEAFIRRNIASVLQNAMGSGNKQLEKLAIQEFLSFVRIFLPFRNRQQLSELSKLLLSNMFRCEELCDPLERTSLAEKVFRQQLHRSEKALENFRRIAKQVIHRLRREQLGLPSLDSDDDSDSHHDRVLDGEARLYFQRKAQRRELESSDDANDKLEED